MPDRVSLPKPCADSSGTLTASLELASTVSFLVAQSKRALPIFTTSTRSRETEVGLVTPVMLLAVITTNGGGALAGRSCRAKNCPLLSVSIGNWQADGGVPGTSCSVSRKHRLELLDELPNTSTRVVAAVRE
ncbi:hypothetical protein D9M71_365570 [compost metagenome]